METKMQKYIKNAMDTLNHHRKNNPNLWQNKTYNMNDYICDTGDNIYFVEAGLVGLVNEESKNSKNGKPTILYYLFYPEDYAVATEFFYDVPQTFIAKILEQDTIIYSIDKKTWESECKNNAELLKAAEIIHIYILSKFSIYYIYSKEYPEVRYKKILKFENPKLFNLTGKLFSSFLGISRSYLYKLFDLKDSDIKTVKQFFWEDWEKKK